VAAKLPKRIIQVLEQRSDVGRIFLIEAKPQPALDIAVPSDRVSPVWRQGIDGTGTTIGIVELGVVDFGVTSSDCPAGTNHCFLHPGGSRYGVDLQDYYNHTALVANTAAGNHSLYKGVAPGATIYTSGMTGTSQDAELTALEWALNPAPNGWNVDVANVSMQVCSGQTMTWLDLAFDYYVQWWYYDQMVTVAAGDAPQCSGSLNITSPGKAHNILTVGAYDDNGTTNWSDDVMWSGSPYIHPSSAHSDRQKPEVVAPGVNISASIGSETVPLFRGPVPVYLHRKWRGWRPF
jgi:hypothetical protein